MELSDLSLLTKDELTGHTFKSLTILGRIGKVCPKKYLAKCAICVKDSELFGNGYFVVYKKSLLNGIITCGCNPKYIYTKNQQEIRVKRLMSDSPYRFLGWSGEYAGVQKTKCVINCPAHGEWDTTPLGNLFSKPSDCPECVRLSFMKANVKSDAEMIQSFFDSGMFHPATKFSRSSTLTKKGYKEYWHVDCPTCGEQVEGRSYHLQAGKHSCACSNYSQRQAYINILLDGNIPVALKFGIAKNSINRALKQSKESSFDLVTYGVWEFPDVKSCKAAERRVKDTVDCGVVRRAEFPDGFTETTYAYNLDVITEIYKSFGGVMMNKINNLGAILNV